MKTNNLLPAWTGLACLFFSGLARWSLRYPSHFIGREGHLLIPGKRFRHTPKLALGGALDVNDSP